MKKMLPFALSFMLIFRQGGAWTSPNSVWDTSLQSAGGTFYIDAGFFKSTHVVSSSHSLTSIENKAQIATFSGTDDECIKSMCGCVRESMESFWESSAIELDLCPKGNLDEAIHIPTLYNYDMNTLHDLLESENDIHTSINDVELYYKSKKNVVYEHDGTYYKLPPTSYQKFKDKFTTGRTCGNTVKYLEIDTYTTFIPPFIPPCGDIKYAVAPEKTVYRKGAAADEDIVINEKDSSLLIEAATHRLDEKVCINMCESRLTGPEGSPQWNDAAALAARHAELVVQRVDAACAAAGSE